MPDASSQPEKTRLEQTAEVLHRHGVEFLIIGGQAEGLMGSPRPTYDVDVCCLRTRDNLTKLARALNELKARPRDYPIVVGEVEPVGGYEVLVESAETYDISGIRVRTIWLDDLIRVKRHLGRPKDLQSLYQLLAIKRVREESGER